MKNQSKITKSFKITEGTKKTNLKPYTNTPRPKVGWSGTNSNYKPTNNNINIEKFKELISDESSEWLEKAMWRKENRGWLEMSAIIAIKILRELRKQKLSKEELVKKTGISIETINNILKGQENLTLEIINKIEKALNIILIEL